MAAMMISWAVTSLIRLSRRGIAADAPRHKSIDIKRIDALSADANAIVGENKDFTPFTCLDIAVNVELCSLPIMRWFAGLTRDI